MRLLVSARDQNGAILSNLGKGDFQVFDNDVQQTVSIFERNTSLPLSIAILVDTSGSTRKDLGYETASILKISSSAKESWEYR